MQPKTRRLAHAPGTEENRSVVRVVGPARDTPFPLRIEVNMPPRDKPKMPPPMTGPKPFKKQMAEFASDMAREKTGTSPPPNTI